MANVCYPTNRGLIESNENFVNFCQTCSWNEFEKAGNFEMNKRIDHLGPHH